MYNCILYYFHRGDDPRKHEWFKSINFARLEAGLIDPPWVPKPNVVYAKDTGDIAEFSEIKGIEFDAKDDVFFKEFSTGAVPIAWQQEMIDTGLFDELNDPNRKESAGGGDDEKKSGTCTLLWGTNPATQPTIHQKKCFQWQCLPRRVKCDWKEMGRLSIVA